MLVYGDSAWSEPPREKLAALARNAAAIWDAPPGIARHSDLGALFIAAGELAQGLADADFARAGADARLATNDAAMRLLIGLARAAGRSWTSGFRVLGESPLPLLHALQAARHPPEIRVSLPEGYAFYALYPETYVQAAKALAGRPLRIVGLRSIGTGLAAAVAAGAGQDHAVTVRPVGHPFRRELRLSGALSADLLSNPAAEFAVVDEGPGLSGSSLGCVADFLEDGGVVRNRIHFFPSHPGPPGPEASPRHRERWDKAQRHHVGFDDLVLRAPDPAHRLEAWAADLGEPVAPMTDLSGGAWRKLHFRSEAEWPAANTQQERRKFLLQTQDGPWLLKFAGLGRYGAEKLALARTLASAGFTTPVAGFRHGFIVERWLAEARPLRALPADRRGAVERIGRYLGFRAREFPAERPGAPLEELAAMATRNIGLALGNAASERALAPWMPRLEKLAHYVCPVRTDNRLHAWEWLAMSGRLVKADALDHHAAHDLVGCQDLAWDAAGAAVEFGLMPEETERLCAIAERESGRSVAPELMDFLGLCYLAFQLGAFSLAADAHVDNPAEAARLRGAAGRYTDRLKGRLGGGGAALAPSHMGEPSCA